MDKDLEQQITNIVIKTLDSQKRVGGALFDAIKAESTVVSKERNTCAFAEIDHLSKALADLESEVKALSDRISPALRTQSDNVIGIATSKNDRDSALVNVLSEQISRIHYITNSIRDLSVRSQLL